MQITVRVVENEEFPGKMNVNIEIPKEQQKMSTQQAAHILTAGVNLIIKSCGSEGIKDHELITEVIEHLRSEFINSKSYDDVFRNNKYIVDEEVSGD